MVLRKDWLRNEIDSEPNPEVRLFGERIFQKYTETPKKGDSHQQSTLQEFDRDETYKKIVTYYMNNQKFKEQHVTEERRREAANAIALDVVTREIERRNLKK